MAFPLGVKNVSARKIKNIEARKQNRLEKPVLSVARTEGLIMRGVIVVLIGQCHKKTLKHYRNKPMYGIMSNKKGNMMEVEISTLGKLDEFYKSTGKRITKTEVDLLRDRGNDFCKYMSQNGLFREMTSWVIARFILEGRYI